MTLHRARASRFALLGALAALAFSAPARADLQWDWQYAATGITAAGVITTTDTADADGWYQIIGISGLRNGESITGLQANGTAIPLNEPFAVDNLVKADGTLSSHGLGFSTAGGHYANVFFAGWAKPPGPFEFWSLPASSQTGESRVSWSFASQVPEPSTTALAMAGGGLLWWLGRRKSRAVQGR